MANGQWAVGDGYGRWDVAVGGVGVVGGGR